MEEYIEIIENEKEVVEIVENVDAIIPTLENLEVTPSIEEQEFNHEGFYGYDKVKVKAVKLQDKTVEPSTIEQTITADEEYTSLGSVTVNAVTSAIDSDIKATNIRSGVNILGVTGTMEEYVEPNLQSKSATPKTTAQTITPDSSYDGLSSVSISAVTSSIDSNIVAENIKDGVEILGVTGTLQEGITPTGTLDITENGEYDVTEYANATVNVEGGGKYAPRYLYAGNLFYNYTGTELDYEIANLDVSNMTNMYNMFAQAHNLKSLDLSGWDTTNVTDMRNMFYYAGRNSQGFTLNLGGKFNTANVTNMYAMFNNSRNLKTLNVDNFDTRKVTNMAQMFYDCYYLETLDVSNFNTSNVTNMSYMFYDCYHLETLDLSNFDTSNVTDMRGMFDSCSNLTYLDIRNFTFDKVTSYTRMFQYVLEDCLIVVKSDTERNWILTNGRSDLTNIKTVAELES